MYDFDRIKRNLETRGANFEFNETGFGGTLKYRADVFAFMAGLDDIWEHVSVSTKKRCPTWNEMCLFKDIFWAPDEACVQFHPPRSQYVNVHPFCLHIWRQVDGEVLLPPKILI